VQDPPKFTQVGIFGLKICHLATLMERVQGEKTDLQLRLYGTQLDVCRAEVARFLLTRHTKNGGKIYQMATLLPKGHRMY
jgi:hypothetical protein